MNYILQYDVAAIVISLTVMLHFFIKKNLDSTVKRLYSALVICAFISPVLDIVDCYTTTFYMNFPLWIVYCVKGCYLIAFNSCAFFYYGYILNATYRDRLSVADRILWLFPIVIDIVLIMITPFTNGVFYFADNEYHYGNHMIVLYVIALYYIVMSLVCTLRFHNRMTATQQASVCFFTLSSIAAVIIQMVNPSLMIAPFAVSISILLVYLSLENPQNYEDKQLGTFNREAFVEVVNSRIGENRKFSIIGIQLDGMKYINNAVGVENGNDILRSVSEFLMSTSCKAFHISGVRFALLVNEKNHTTQEIIDIIRDRFGRPFMCQGAEVHMSAFMCCMNYPDNVKSLEDIVETIEYSLKDFKEQDNAVIENASEEILERKRRENKILQIMKKAVAENLFQVYYQPIYSVKKGYFTSLEALVRLQDEELGFISPEEFIPLAEQHGLIFAIGEYVFKTVCSFIITNSIYKKGIEYIEVINCTPSQGHNRIEFLPKCLACDILFLKI